MPKAKGKALELAQLTKGENQISKKDLCLF